jgi:hypothetical protein
MAMLDYYQCTVELANTTSVSLPLMFDLRE